MAIWTMARPSLDSQSFASSSDWKRAPLLRGLTKFKPLDNVRNIMVTGGAGFIGSWVARHLVLTYPESYHIVVFDKLDYCSSINNIRMLEAMPNFKFVHGDVTCADDVMRCLRAHKIDVVIHCAAQSHVDLSFQNSYTFIRDNIYGTNVLLESVKQSGICRFIHVSTDEVYGEVPDEGEDLPEDSILAPSNPYSASKAAAEMMILAYSKSFGLPAIMVRLNNVYGPHQFPEKIIPKFITLLQRGQKLMVYGDGTNSRRYLWAGDAADAFDTILHKGSVGQIYNVGSQSEITNLELCEKVLNLFGITNMQNWIDFTEDRPFNDHRYATSGSKLQALGWKQQTLFEDGLLRTIQWYRDFPDWWGDINQVLTAFHGTAKASLDHAKHTGSLAEMLGSNRM
ncbi:dtdp-glucose 4-6-dehydratase [Penicillium sp. IBT 31633x]|nr:dtdp-glucose 4-6-dehydratase [Penicillium sp. IBT 31633x]